MDRRHFLSILGGSLALAAKAAPKPNFVFVLADDLGWKDLACFGSRFYETPNLDRLARGGKSIYLRSTPRPRCARPPGPAS